MKKLLLLLLFFPVCLYSQNLKDKDKDAVKKVMLMQEEAWNRGDIDGYMSGYWKSDSLKFITKKGINRGWESVMAMYKKSYPGKAEMGHLDFEIKNISSIGKKLVHVFGTWKLTETGKEASGTFALIFRKNKKNWEIIIDHTW